MWKASFCSPSSLLLPVSTERCLLRLPQLCQVASCCHTLALLLWPRLLKAPASVPRDQASSAATDTCLDQHLSLIVCPCLGQIIVVPKKGFFFAFLPFESKPSFDWNMQYSEVQECHFLFSSNWSLLALKVSISIMRVEHGWLGS